MPEDTKSEVDVVDMDDESKSAELLDEVEPDEETDPEPEDEDEDDPSRRTNGDTGVK